MRVLGANDHITSSQSATFIKQYISLYLIKRTSKTPELFHGLDNLHLFPIDIVQYVSTFVLNDTPEMVHL